MPENSIMHDLYVNTCNLVGDLKENPKQFYPYINIQKRRNSRYSAP